MQRLGSIDHQEQSTNANLVKIASFSKDKPSDMMNAGVHYTTMTEWIGADCPVDYLNVCFTKAWAATFSFVTIMIVKDRSMTSRPAIMAAAERVLPAPKIPLMGQSVFALKQ